MNLDYRFEEEIAAAESVPPAHEPDAFERMVGGQLVVLLVLGAGRTRRWISRAILFATITLLLLNAQSLHSWATTLPPGWASETTREIVDTWNDRLAMIGLDRPRKAIHDEYEGWKGKSAS